MGKPVLSKRDLVYLSKISDAKEQSRLTKRLLADKAEGMARSAKSFAKLRADRKARIEAPLTVGIRTSKRGDEYIVASGGGLMASVWLSLTGAQSLIAAVPQVKALIPKLNTDEQVGEEETDAEVEDQE